MAEQAAEERLKKNENSFNGFEKNYQRKENFLSQSNLNIEPKTQVIDRNSMANLLKLQQLNEKYGNLVDKNLLKDILKDKK